MRIAFDVSYVQRELAGIGRASYGLLSSLLAQDHQNEYVLHGWSRSLDTLAVADLRRDTVSQRVRRIPGFVKRFYWNRLRRPTIERFIGPVDLFHSADPFSPPSRCPTIVTLHDVISFDHPEWFTHAVIARHRALARSLDCASAIIVPSEWTRDRLSDLQPTSARKAEVVHWVADPSFGTQVSGESDEETLRKLGVNTPYVLFVGTLEPRKNLINLLEGFRLFCAGSADDLTLVVAGKKGWKIHSLERELGRQARPREIHLTGYVAQTDLPALYRKARVFVYPSLDEGFGLPVLEALSCGAVVVTSDIPPLRELYRDSAIFVDPHRPDAIAEGLRRANEDNELRASLMHEGLSTASRFSPDNAAKQMLGIYAKLC